MEQRADMKVTSRTEKPGGVSLLSVLWGGRARLQESTCPPSSCFSLERKHGRLRGNTPTWLGRKSTSNPAILSDLKPLTQASCSRGNMGETPLSSLHLLRRRCRRSFLNSVTQAKTEGAFQLHGWFLWFSVWCEAGLYIFYSTQSYSIENTLILVLLFCFQNIWCFLHVEWTPQIKSLKPEEVKLQYSSIVRIWKKSDFFFYYLCFSNFMNHPVSPNIDLQTQSFGRLL